MVCYLLFIVVAVEAHSDGLVSHILVDHSALILLSINTVDSPANIIYNVRILSSHNIY